MTSKLARTAFLIALSVGVVSLLSTLKLVYSDDPVGTTLKIAMSTLIVSTVGIVVGVTVLLTSAAREALTNRSVRRARRW
jgi:hypothetical protein